MTKSCLDCRKRRAPALQQKMAKSPRESCVTPSKPPFTSVGVDCFGPFTLRRGDILLQRDIVWSLKPPAALHYGGVWERCIMSVRKVMKALIKQQILDDEGLSTPMCEVESIVNGRPITKGSSCFNT